MCVYVHGGRFVCHGSRTGGIRLRVRSVEPRSAIDGVRTAVGPRSKEAVGSIFRLSPAPGYSSAQTTPARGSAASSPVSVQYGRSINRTWAGSPSGVVNFNWKVVERLCKNQVLITVVFLTVATNGILIEQAVESGGHNRGFSIRPD